MKVLIVGGGVAGISLFERLLADRQDVFLLDRGINACSSAAAGMINPIAFRSMSKSWRADELIPCLKSFYRQMEENVQARFFHAVPIRRLFDSMKEMDLWKKKESSPEFGAYLNPLTEEDLSYSLAPGEFGSGRVGESYWVNAKLFIPLSLKWIAGMDRLIEADLNYDEIDPKAPAYKGVRYDKIVFCEGAHSRENPWFKHLPIHATKGETLTIKSDFLPESESLNRKCFAVPIEPKTFRIGATYAWHSYDAAATEAGRLELEEKLACFSREPYDLIAQEAGIRPTTPDRRPILGQHHIHRSLHIFNGLGTKGYMLAPLLAEEFADFLIRGHALSSEVDLCRFREA